MAEVKFYNFYNKVLFDNQYPPKQPYTKISGIYNWFNQRRDDLVICNGLYRKTDTIKYYGALPCNIVFYEDNLYIDIFITVLAYNLRIRIYTDDRVFTTEFNQK